MNSAHNSSAGSLGRSTFLRRRGALLERPMMNEAKDGLEKGDGQDGQSKLRMNIIPNAECGCLLSQPNSHACCDDVEQVGQDLKQCVKLQAAYGQYR
jgi:hypothetical protein